ncbi:MAG: hypothetical protein D6689_17415 [Deltaproteobacteria bacterium]|nr:MAG: hypothetical protein D6689_17415 [Deltaproteobacteria bacterium]
MAPSTRHAVAESSLLEPPRTFRHVPARPASHSSDPISLVRLGVKIRDVYSAEPRDGAWADEAESFYRDAVTELLRELLPDATDLEVSCRHNSCRFQFAVPAAERDEAYTFQQLLPLGDIVQPWSQPAESTKSAIVGAFVLLGSEHRDLGKLRAWYAREFARRFPDGLRVVREHIATHGLSPVSTD